MARTDFVAFKHKIHYYASLAIFGLILYNLFGEGSNSAHLSERIADLIMISEEHWKNDETLFHSVNKQRKSVNLMVRAMPKHIVFVTFCLWVPLHDERKLDVLVLENIWNSIYW